MTWHITLTEDDGPIGLPDSNDLLNLNDALRDLLDVIRAVAQHDGTAGMWGAARCLEDACYDIHGAAGWLAKDEGLIP